MDGNKDEALRCIQIAKGAISAGDKSRALKFIKIAQRLDVNLAVDDLLAACENLDTEDSDSHKEGSSKHRDFDLNGSRDGEKDDVFAGMPNGSRDYSEENVQLIRKIKKSKDYYAILGVEKTCTVEEIRKAYRKLSLKVHPDKNKAPGSDDAFKIVSKAFKCLSDDDSRRQYDHTGLIEDFEVTQQYGARRRRRTRHDFGDDNFDPDEIFRSFFSGSADMFNNVHVYRTRTRAREPARETETTGSNFNVLVLLQILPIFVILLMAYLPFSEPEFALQKTQTHRVAKLTEQYGVEYYVKHPDFDQNFPLGSAGRSRIENNVVREYKNLLGRYCHMEMQRRQWNRNYPTPHCDKLHSFGVN